MKLSVQVVVVVVGIVLSVVGLFTENWKISVVGNTLCVGALLFQ